MELRKWSLRALGGPAFIFLPRAAPGLLALAGVYSCFRLPPSKSELRRLLFCVFVIAAYPALSTLWALSTRRALTVVLSATVIAAVSILVFRRAGRLKDIFRPAVTFGVPMIAFVCLFDVLLDIPIRTALAEMGLSWVGQPATVGKTGQVESSAVNWSIAILTLSLFPYLNATRAESAGRTSMQALRLAVAIATALAVFLSPHQSSMLAICVGALVLVIAHASKNVAVGLVAFGWLTSIAATPLIASIVLPWTQSLASAIPQSAQHRLVIWQVALKDVARSPWIGSGAGSTRIVFREREMNRKRLMPTGLAAHSHNWFMDLWRELGAVGAALAIACVAFITQRSFSSLHHISRELIAFSGLVLAMSTTSFGLWEVWYLSAIGLSFAMFGLTRSHPSTIHPDFLPDDAGQALDWDQFAGANRF